MGMPVDEHGVNQGENLTAVHPLIRTNPVTGWKSVFVNKGLVLPAIRGELQIDRHLGSANYVFLDAHVETIAASQIEQWVAEKFEFARPQ